MYRRRPPGLLRRAVQYKRGRYLRGTSMAGGSMTCMKTMGPCGPGVLSFAVHVAFCRYRYCSQ